MTTSAAISSTMLAGEIISAAMQDLGVLSAGEVPTGEETVLGIRTLNWMLKSWQSRGLTSWRETTGNITIPAGSAYGSLAPDITDITSARVFNGSYERPLHRYERGQYMGLPNKGSVGAPTIYYAEQQVDVVNLFVWPVPIADTVVLLDYVRIAEDVTDAGQTIDIPQRWLETVTVALASRLAAPFGVARTDPAAAQMMAQRAASLEQLMLDADRPASVFMGSAYGRQF